MSEMDMSAYLGVFLDEVNEQIQILDEEILNLEKSGEDGATIQKIFRAAHTLKGSSAAMGFVDMEHLTHRLENLFDLIRNKELKVSTEIINVFFRSIDSLKLLRDGIINGNSESLDIQPIVSELEQIKNNEEVEKPSEGQPLSENGDSWYDDRIEFPEVVFDDYQQNVIEQALKLDYKVMAIHISLVEDCLLKSVRAFLIYNNLKEIGEIIASFPSIQNIEEDESFTGNLVFILVTTASKQSVISSINSISDIRTVSINLIYEKNIAQFSAGKKVKIGSVEDSETSKEQKDDAVICPTKIEPTVRVNISRLEHLINLVGELVIDQTRLADVRNRLEHRLSNLEEVELLAEVSTHLGQVVTEIQESMMKTRMLPIEQLFNRFPRMVRDISKKEGKEIDLIIEGKETELDRNLIEVIGDPIIHLLRNSIDHGIEAPDVREKLGKRRKGSITLKAYHEDSHIVIKIMDDGKGIDIDRLRMTALKKGLVTEEEASYLSDQECIHLIFKSGLSTAKKITDLSGRGVGMDIVKSSIEKLNGIIDIDSEPGLGTQFTVKLPLTMAIIRSLRVDISGKEYAIPLANVQEIVRLETKEIKTIQNQEVGIIRERVLPLVRMNRLLGIHEEHMEVKKRLFVVVIGLAEKRVGLIVDKTLGNQEIVIKSLGKYVGNPKYISGATIKGDGDVSLILDAPLIVREEGSNDLSKHKLDEKDKKVKNDETIQITTFNLGKEEYGLEIQHVIDIIAVPEITTVMNAPHSILGMIYIREKLVPVMDLRKRFYLNEREANRKSRVIIVDIGNEWIGLLVDRVNEVLKISKDTIELPPDNSNVSEEMYVKGICNLGEKLVILLHVNLLLDKRELVAITNKNTLEKR